MRWSDKTIRALFKWKIGFKNNSAKQSTHATNFQFSPSTVLTICKQSHFTDLLYLLQNTFDRNRFSANPNLSES